MAMTVSLQQIADLVSGQLFGDPDVEVSGVSSIAEAGPGDLVFAESRRHAAEAEGSQASAMLTRHEPESGAKPAVVVGDPRTAFATVLELFAAKMTGEPGIDPTARVHESVCLGDNVSVCYNAFIGADVKIGDNSVILPFCYIGDGVVIGDNTVVNPHVTIYPTCRIGNRVIIHSGAVIGADGFGFNQVEGEHRKIPHIGSVLIEDDVEIGANVTVDRARTGFTEVGAGTKIDNLVHVAHNVKIGRNCIVVAQVGISGSVRVGNNVILAGQAGVKDHVTIGDNVQVAARAGIISDISKGSKIAGFPARPYGDQMRIWASLANLPGLVKQVQTLESRVRALQSELAAAETNGHIEERVPE